MQNKTALRRSLLATRRAIDADTRSRCDADIGDRVLAWWHIHRVKSLGVYWPIRGEPDLRATYEALAAYGVQLALPVVHSPHAPLAFAAWAPGDALVQDALGVSIPATMAIGLRPDALLIPCVGFNAQRVRLGYGGGFYDRTLALAPRPLAIGIAYACAQATFNAAAHDVALDEIITEESVIAQG